MKKSLLLLGIALVALSSCGQKEDPSTPGSDLPSAANIDFTVTVDQSTNEATFALPSSVTGLMPIWHTNETGEFVFAGTGDNFKKVFYQKGSYKVRLFVSNSKGQSLDYSEKDVVIENDKSGSSLTGGFVYDSDFNLWKKVDTEGNHTYSQYTAHTDSWEVLDNPQVIQVGNTYSMTYETGTTNQWQAQFFIIPTEANAITLTAGTTYDFSCVIKSSTDLPGVTFKLTQGDSENDFLFTSERIEVKAGEPYVFWWANQPVEKDITNVKMVFDFGGCPDNSEITVGNIVLKDHANDDGTKDVPERDEPEPEDPDAGYTDDYDKNFVFDLNTPANLWAPSKIEVSKAYYSDANWAEREFVYDIKDGVYTLNFPLGASARWQAQFHLSSDLAIKADKKYAITFTVESNTDHPGFCFKFSGPDDTAASQVMLETKPELKAKAGEARVFHATGIQGLAFESCKLVFDFGGAAENTVIKIKDISIQYYE